MQLAVALPDVSVWLCLPNTVHLIRLPLAARLSQRQRLSRLSAATLAQRPALTLALTACLSPLTVSTVRQASGGGTSLPGSDASGGGAVQSVRGEATSSVRSMPSASCQRTATVVVSAPCVVGS